MVLHRIKKFYILLTCIQFYIKDNIGNREFLKKFDRKKEKFFSKYGKRSKSVIGSAILRQKIRIVQVTGATDINCVGQIKQLNVLVNGKPCSSGSTSLDITDLMEGTGIPPPTLNIVPSGNKKRLSMLTCFAF